MLAGYIPALLKGDFRALSRCISAVENRAEGYEALLEALPEATARIVGVTGPPGAGKSTLIDALLALLVERGKRVAVLVVDPSSPFHHGALLGDRVRMTRHYDQPGVYIRSLATRGSLGGLHPEITGISTLAASAGFDYVIIETVGVGQSEVEIASLADTTVVVFVPSSGDEVQAMKAGLMEIADVFVVNKADQPGSDLFAKNLRTAAAARRSGRPPVPVLKTDAVKGEGVAEVLDRIDARAAASRESPARAGLLAARAYGLIQARRMKDVDLQLLAQRIENERKKGDFNLYRFVRHYEEEAGNRQTG